jgi:hypothetical protein
LSGLMRARTGQTEELAVNNLLSGKDPSRSLVVVRIIRIIHLHEVM